MDIFTFKIGEKVSLYDRKSAIFEVNLKLNNFKGHVIAVLRLVDEIRLHNLNFSALPLNNEADKRLLFSKIGEVKERLSKFLDLNKRAFHELDIETVHLKMGIEEINYGKGLIH
jgi:hypothetical protein